ncbi:MAG: hypothetical protein HPY57_14795 [Ignavibacteria bacterium]|nr:hypothetical protein [Ignavibacteria bacterium]
MKKRNNGLDNKNLKNTKKFVKIIFLDIDGVLYTTSHYTWLSVIEKQKSADKYGFLFDPKCIANLNEIIEKTGAKIVISSTWRRRGIDYLRECFKYRGINAEIIDLTPISTIDNLFFCRGEEIEQWLIENGLPEKIAVLDDSSLGDGYDDWKFFYKTNMTTGITEEINFNK